MFLSMNWSHWTSMGVRRPSMLASAAEKSYIRRMYFLTASGETPINIAGKRKQPMVGLSWEWFFSSPATSVSMSTWFSTNVCTTSVSQSVEDGASVLRRSMSSTKPHDSYVCNVTGCPRFLEM